MTKNPRPDGPPPLLLGRGADHRLVTIDLDRHAHILVCGPTGSGVSTVLAGLAAQIRGMGGHTEELAGTDLNATRWPGVRAATPEALADTVTRFRDTAVTPPDRQAGGRTPSALIIDDAPLVLERANQAWRESPANAQDPAELTRDLAEIATVGRTTNTHLIIGGQQPAQIFANLHRHLTVRIITGRVSAATELMLFNTKLRLETPLGAQQIAYAIGSGSSAVGVADLEPSLFSPGGDAAGQPAWAISPRSATPSPRTGFCSPFASASTPRGPVTT